MSSLSQSNSGPISRVHAPAHKHTDELLLLPTFQQTCPDKTKFSESQVKRYSLRLVFLPHIRFTAKSSAALGSFCQSRLCSSARRINLKPRRARFRALRLRSAPEIDSASLHRALAHYETNVFYWPVKAQFSHWRHTQMSGHALPALARGGPRRRGAARVRASTADEDGGVPAATS